MPSSVPLPSGICFSHILLAEKEGSPEGEEVAVNAFCQKEVLDFDSQMGTALPKGGYRKSVLVSHKPHLLCRNSAVVLSPEAFCGLVY